ncbi:IS2 transposase [Escherichia coli]|nr:IS2 transposase [Escherichia coli]GDN67889.1 IS2 transposase [Escherichia coli]
MRDVVNATMFDRYGDADDFLDSSGDETCLLKNKKFAPLSFAVKNLAEAFGYYNEWHLHSALGYPRHGNICGSGPVMS